MATTTDTPSPGPTRPARRRGRVLFWVFVAAWVVAVAAIYIVIVRLKLGGEAGIRLQPPTPAETPAPATVGQ